MCSAIIVYSDVVGPYVFHSCFSFSYLSFPPTVFFLPSSFLLRLRFIPLFPRLRLTARSSPRRLVSYFFSRLRLLRLRRLFRSPTCPSCALLDRLPRRLRFAFLSSSTAFTVSAPVSAPPTRRFFLVPPRSPTPPSSLHTFLSSSTAFTVSAPGPATRHLFPCTPPRSPTLPSSLHTFFPRLRLFRFRPLL